MKNLSNKISKLNYKIYKFADEIDKITEDFSNSSNKTEDEMFDEIEWEDFKNPQPGDLLEIAGEFLPKESKATITNYIEKNYPDYDENGRDINKMLNDPNLKVLKQYYDKVNTKYQEYLNTSTQGDRDYKQYQNQQQYNNQQKEYKNRTSKPLTDNDLDVLNTKTTYQLDIKNTISKLLNNQFKGNLTVQMIVNPDSKIDYVISNTSAPLDNSLKDKITKTLHMYDRYLLSDISNKMKNQNKVFNNSVQNILFDGAI